MCDFKVLLRVCLVHVCACVFRKVWGALDKIYRAQKRLQRRGKEQTES